MGRQYETRTPPTSAKGRGSENPHDTLIGTCGLRAPTKKHVGAPEVPRRRKPGRLLGDSGRRGLGPRSQSRVENRAKCDHAAIKSDCCRLDPRLCNQKCAAA
jgi:hypothetical protein